MTAQDLIQSLSNTTLRVIRDDLKRHKARILAPSQRASLDPFIKEVEHELSLSDACITDGEETQI